ncbi:MAG: tetratricopeptide repeat protein, partial [Clostridiales bacterium]|nr:tetratricopeptide repeat protein [Clostridiales bacterium]
YKALAIKKKVLGAEHPDTATTYNNIALAYHAQGDYDKARDLFCRAVIVMNIRKLGEHPHTRSAFTSMRDAYLKAGGKEENFDGWFKERTANYPVWCE